MQRSASSIASPKMDNRCVLCDRNFGSPQALQQHLDSPVHAFDCDECDRRFGSEKALQQHLNSPVHAFDCDECDRRFGSEKALQQHLDSPVHAFDCDECDRRFGSEKALQQHLNSSIHVSNYEGIPRPIVESVYAVAYRLRHKNPTVSDVLRRSKFVLEDGIVDTMIRAAQRLLPVDNTVEGTVIRVENHRIMALEAKRAEDNFCAALARQGYIFLGEDQQRGSTVTPDVLFQNPTLICGHLCLWLEYKNTFGFRSKPFVAASTKKQLLRYATQIGPGAVVYRLGYETGHLPIQGVMSFREKEVLEYLRRRPRQLTTQNLAMILPTRLNKALNTVPKWISDGALASDDDELESVEA